MSVAVVVGMQWGDEGKGKIIDLFSEEADVIARYAGGHNAGHTIVFDGNQHMSGRGNIRGKDISYTLCSQWESSK